MKSRGWPEPLKRDGKVKVVNYLDSPSRRRGAAEIQTETKMATRAKYPTDGVGNVNRTFETFSVDSSVVEDKLFPSTETEDDDDDGPVVFICAKCKLPVGDSMSWDSNQDGQTHIQLKRKLPSRLHRLD